MRGMEALLHWLFFSIVVVQAGIVDIAGSKCPCTIVPAKLEIVEGGETRIFHKEQTPVVLQGHGGIRWPVAQAAELALDREISLGRVVDEAPDRTAGSTEDERHVID